MLKMYASFQEWYRAKQLELEQTGDNRLKLVLSYFRNGKDGYNACNPPLLARIQLAFDDFKNGIKFGYPLCCIIHFCLDVFLNRAPWAERKTKRDVACVPCYLHWLRMSHGEY
jgi:hypothetical protein